MISLAVTHFKIKHANVTQLKQIKIFFLLHNWPKTNYSSGLLNAFKAPQRKHLLFSSNKFFLKALTSSHFSQSFFCCERELLAISANIKNALHSSSVRWVRKKVKIKFCERRKCSGKNKNKMTHTSLYCFCVH